MGEVAEMMTDGTLCQSCGVFIEAGDNCGVPRHCNDCQPRSKAKQRKPKIVPDSVRREMLTKEAEGLRRNIAIRQKRLDDINTILASE